MVWYALLCCVIDSRRVRDERDMCWRDRARMPLSARLTPATTNTNTITTITTIMSSAGYLQRKPGTSQCAFHRSSSIDMPYLAVWLWRIHGRIV
jgi:hypothetical protein